MLFIFFLLHPGSIHDLTPEKAQRNINQGG